MREQEKININRFWVASLGAILLAAVMLGLPAVSSAEVAIGVSVTLAPPALPVYVQPPCPGPGYIWTPGYWAWDEDTGYYWVPGTWVLAPSPGLLWTPGYWGWNDGVFIWNAGYWGPVVGFYGGINYGFGYTGIGYAGGYWEHGEFFYNRAVNNISVTNIRNVYNKTVINHVTVTRVSYNGGTGGTTVRPTAAELAAARERHISPTQEQTKHELAARADPNQRVAVNHGRPAVAASPKPGVLTGHGVVRATRAGAPYKEMPSGHNAGSGAGARTSNPAGTERSPSGVVPEHVAPQRPDMHNQPPKGENRQQGGRPPVVAPEHGVPRGDMKREEERPH